MVLPSYPIKFEAKNSERVSWVVIGHKKHTTNRDYYIMLIGHKKHSTNRDYYIMFKDKEF